MTESTVGALVTRDAIRLESVSASPLLDCQIIACHILGRNRAWLYAHDDSSFSDLQRSCYDSLINRRLAGEPVAYLTGEREFWDRSFRVSPATLIPRPETELLVTTLLERFDNSPRIVADLGTGSGAIAVCLAVERPGWQVTGIDSSKDALRIAEENGRGLQNLEFREGHWCRGLRPGSVDIIVTNPPYVREGDPHLAFLSFEPRGALTAGKDGLVAIREIIDSGYDCLRAGGCLMTEHGYDQQRDVVSLMTARGYREIEVFADLDGTPRAVLARR